MFPNSRQAYLSLSILLVKIFYQVFSSHADGMVSCDVPCDGRGCFGLQSSLIIACASYFWMDDLGANLSLPLTRPRQTLQSLIFLMGHPGCLWIKLLSEWNQCLGLSVFTVSLNQKKGFSFVKISHLSLLSWFRLVFYNYAGPFFV